MDELVVAGIYIRLFIANPGWVLRKPREFLSESIETALTLMKNRGRDQKKLEDLTMALVKLLTFQPNLADMIPATGYLSRLFETRDDVYARYFRNFLLDTLFMVDSQVFKNG